MNNTKSIWVTLLAGYFLMLPVLFAVHAFEHDHEHHEEHYSELSLFESEEECELCDLYDHIVTALEILYFYNNNLRTEIFDIIDTIGIELSFRIFNCLRGPPAI